MCFACHVLCLLLTKGSCFFSSCQGGCVFLANRVVFFSCHGGRVLPYQRRRVFFLPRVVRVFSSGVGGVFFAKEFSFSCQEVVFCFSRKAALLILARRLCGFLAKGPMFFTGKELSCFFLRGFFFAKGRFFFSVGCVLFLQGVVYFLPARDCDVSSYKGL